MLIKKIKHRLAAILAAALVLQGISASVPAAGQETGGELLTEAVQQQATGVNVAYHTQDIKKLARSVEELVEIQLFPCGKFGNWNYVIKPDKR